MGGGLYDFVTLTSSVWDYDVRDDSMISWLCHLQVRKALGEKVIEHDNSPAIHLGNRTKTL
jgi:hypothetical protein